MVNIPCMSSAQPPADVRDHQRMCFGLLITRCPPLSQACPRLIRPGCVSLTTWGPVGIFPPDPDPMTSQSAVCEVPFMVCYDPVHVPVLITAHCFLCCLCLSPWFGFTSLCPHVVVCLLSWNKCSTSADKRVLFYSILFPIERCNYIIKFPVILQQFKRITTRTEVWKDMLTKTSLKLRGVSVQWAMQPSQTQVAIACYCYGSYCYNY